jgi:hypothetical protein
MLVKDPTTGQMRIDKSTLPPVKYLDTGKVKIGCAIAAKPMPLSCDAEQIQGALLGIPSRMFSTLPYLTYYAVVITIITAFLLVSCK